MKPALLEAHEVLLTWAIFMGIKIINNSEIVKSSSPHVCAAAVQLMDKNGKILRQHTVHASALVKMEACNGRRVHCRWQACLSQ